MSSPWLKFYPSDWRADPALRMCSLAARGLWMEMLCLMHEATPRGSLLVNGRPIDGKQLAALCGVALRDVVACISQLEAAGVFSREDNRTIYSRRMRRDDEKAERDKANGKGGGNPTLKGGVNPPVKAQIPEARDQKPEQQEGTRASALAVADDWPADFREQFWQVYPNKVGKPLAIQKLELTRKSHRATWAELSAGLDDYVHKTDDRPWCNPATWIHQQRWNDKPAIVAKTPRDAQQQRSDDALEQLRNYNRSRGENGGETARLLLEDSSERSEDFHDGDDRIDDELPGLDRLAAR